MIVSVSKGAWIVAMFDRAWIVAMSATLAGCASLPSGDAAVAQLRSRASFDLNCPQSELHTVTIDDRTRGVRGCGKQATYVESYENVTRISHFRQGEKDNCTWVLNADARHRDAPEQAGAAGGGEK